MNRTKTLDYLLRDWKIAKLANRLGDINTTSTRKVLNELIAESVVEEEKEEEKENNLSEAAIVSIVYAIAFTLVFADYLILKLFRLKERRKIFPAPLPPRKQSVIVQSFDKFKRRLTLH